MNQEYITVNEVERRYKCHHRTVQKLIKKGDLEAMIIAPNTVAVSIASCEKYFTKPKGYKSLKELAFKIGVSKQRVYQKVREANLGYISWKFTHLYKEREVYQLFNK